MLRTLTKPRRGTGYTIRRPVDIDPWIYVLGHGEIKPGGRKGIWQFDFAKSPNGERKPHIFFTCPHCGTVNKDYLGLGTLEERSSRSYYRYIRVCHYCLACRRKIPYALKGGAKKIRREYEKLMSARESERRNGMVTNVNITISDKHLKNMNSIAKKLSQKGLKAATIQKEIGTITGNIDENKLVAIRKILGIGMVEAGKTVWVAPPESKVQ